MQPIAIYGAGGFGRETECLLREINAATPTWDFVGFFDDSVPAGTRCGNSVVLGGMNALNARNGELAVVFAIASPRNVETLVGKITNPNIAFPNIVAPTARVLDPATLRLGRGNLISHHSSISCNVELGNFNLFNTQIYIGHDSRIGDFNMFNPCTRISGNVRIGNRNFFGVASVVLQGVPVGDDVTLGANSVLFRPAQNRATYFGNPASKFEF